MSLTIPCCEHCGAERPDTTALGDLAAAYQGHQITYKGNPLPFLSIEARIIWQLLRRGYASKDSLASHAGADGISDEAIRKHISRIRKKLREHHVPFVIETIYGFGFAIKAAEAVEA